ncbi:hypothetical protein [Pseudactinotalea terrae]|uniref:hypothetical protein n=1 Tax=Pseudactinotalea terrae TaxID=1743262 RepID=UPI0012E146E4|nr:hypothetical protein [Pseudactinotalea terrae]
MAPAEGEAAQDYLEVSPVPTNRRSSPSAWEDGTPLRARTAHAEWPRTQVVTATEDVDATALLTPAPTPGGEQPTAAVTAVPVGVPLVQRLPLRTIGLVGAVLSGAAALTCAVVTAGTIILPPLGALAAVAGLVRAARAGAR